MDQRLNFVTLAVADVDRSRSFYVDGLGWKLAFEAPGEVLFLPVGDSIMLSLWSREGFEEEVGPLGEGLPPVTLAHNVGSPREVEGVLADARKAGATDVSDGTRRDWGGFSGYFADPDGFRWEVAHNPTPLADGLVAASRDWVARARRSGESEQER